MNIRRFFRFPILILCLSPIYSFAQQKVEFLLTDGQLLSKYRLLNKQGDPAAVDMIKRIVKQGDGALKLGPYSVIFKKTKMAPTNNKQDYVSQAPYWWPDPSKPDGKPYIRKDGKRNPEIYLLNDRSQLGDLSTTLKKLGLAYYFTGNEKYAVRARLLLDTWFINKDTRMNANLTYGQYIPGLNDGRGIGIIETRGLIDIPESIALLQESTQMDHNIIEGVKTWFKVYTDWLLTSDNGKDESAQTNNHGTNYDLQVVDFALFTGNKTLAAKIIKDASFKRLDQQFTTEGKQPLELARTRSWDYTNMNLEAWCKLAILSKYIGIDLWHKQTNDGKGIKSAVKWLIPYASGQQAWKTQQITSFEYGDTKSIMSKASAEYPDLSFEPFFKRFPAQIDF